MRRIQDAVVVITGASSGIGRATAIELARAGAVVVVASRDAAALEDVVRDECGGNALAIAADVTNVTEVEAVARRAVEAFGRLDVWINNAAVALFAKFEDAPLETYRRVIDTNLFGYIHGARAALPYFKRQGSGVLINVDSVTAGAPQPYTSAYVASKYAIRGWAACLRMELSLEKAHDIHVCSVLPAAIDTPLFQHAANYTGRAPKALDPVYAPEKVARAIAGLIENPRAEIVVGKAGTVMLANHAMSPRMYERVMARQIDRNHFQEKPAPPTEGNLFRTAGPKATHGGWRRKGTITAEVGRNRWPVAVGAAALLAAAALAASRRMR